jgi:hypothetical protein
MRSAGKQPEIASVVEMEQQVISTDAVLLLFRVLRLLEPLISGVKVHPSSSM